MKEENILIIAYSFPPDKAVAALRPAYWAKSLSKKGYQVEVYTNTRGSEKVDIHPSCTIRRIELGPKPSLSLIADQGIRWLKPLRMELSKQEQRKYKAIIITGGPFMHMRIGPFIKRTFETKLILDFRDPFAINPRFNDSFFKMWVKKYFERSMCSAADSVVTVNDITAELLQCSINKVTTIDNGYDEASMNEARNVNPTLSRSNLTRVIHTGKFYPELKPTKLMAAIQTLQDFEFAHFGDPLNEPENYDRIKSMPYVPYIEVLANIHAADIGIVFTNGEPFISTTKIFDYLGSEKKILIITNGKKHTGNLHIMTSDNPNVYWSKNDEVEIAAQLVDLNARDYIKVDVTPFSRGFQFEKLLKLIETS